MATTYLAARGNSSDARAVFSSSDATLIQVQTDGTTDVIAVFDTLTLAQAAATALNGD